MVVVVVVVVGVVLQQQMLPSQHQGLQEVIAVPVLKPCKPKGHLQHMVQSCTLSRYPQAVCWLASVDACNLVGLKTQLSTQLHMSLVRSNKGNTLLQNDESL